MNMSFSYSSSSSSATTLGIASNSGLEGDLPDSFFEIADELTAGSIPTSQKIAFESSTGLSSDLYPCAPADSHSTGIVLESHISERENEAEDDSFLGKIGISCSQPINVPGALPFIDASSNLNYNNCKQWRECNNENDNITSRYGNIANFFV
jgi:hypothetical protein